jgi:HD-GYP domain-containing protein (c-di-GMP phosphodiesterase class II)
MENVEPDSADLASAFSNCIDLYYGGYAAEGIQAAVLGVQSARQRADKAWLRKFLTAQGIFEAELHNLPQAFLTFAEIQEICAELEDPYLSHCLWINVSAALAYAEFSEPALSAARVADDHASRIPDTTLRSACRATSLTNASYACLLGRRYSQGLRASVQSHEHLLAYRRVKESETDWDRSLALLSSVYRARLLLRINVLDEAQHWASTCASLAANGNCPRRIGYVVEMTGALCDTYVGRFDLGIGRLKELAAQAVSVAPVLVADALRDLCEAYVVGHRPDLALHYTKVLAKHMHEIRTQRALFHHRRSLGWLAAIAPQTEFKPSRSQFAPRIGRLKVGIESNRAQALQDLCAAAELHDDPSGLHPNRVGELAFDLSIRAGVDKDQAASISAAARLHDIGKIAIPPSILSKRGPLDGAETEIMQSHAVAGAELLDSASIDDYGTSVSVARHHHEWWSGAGYPDKLAGEAIPLAARIAALAESFDAMTHDRAYRPRMSVDRALSVIAERAGTHFDPHLAEIFPSVVRFIEKQHGSLDGYLERNAKKSPFLRARQRLNDQMAAVHSPDALSG